MTVPHRRLLIVAVALLAGGLLGMLTTGGGPGWSFNGWWAAHHTGMMGWPAAGPATAEISGAPTVDVSAFEFGFEPSRVTVPAGQSVNLALINDGALYHDLTIPDLGFQLGAQPGQSARGGLAGAAPGEYGFLCSVPGHADAGMVGVLVVEG